jgi:hypothetical protein
MWGNRVHNPKQDSGLIMVTSHNTGRLVNYIHANSFFCILFHPVQLDNDQWKESFSTILILIGSFAGSYLLKLVLPASLKALRGGDSG